ncbi:hypothetical protein PITCH_A1640016 [uncultured Desulfobacterium sp.]|uniref:KilA-N DNA-binding domain-containing protein n=1 Tax=uncultured Desulfobacterium sp. TaxID=201089 RepID=A0A445MU58_9BACT|nr:hypothetical protein PITCH_A1640016 [uncultured Desulfobacterium sp.]
MKENEIRILVEKIDQSIYLIRGHKIILSPHLAELYGVETRVLMSLSGMVEIPRL